MEKKLVNMEDIKIENVKKKYKRSYIKKRWVF